MSESPEHRTVRLRSEQGVRWPLWEGGATSPEGYDLSPALIGELAAWQRYFVVHFQLPGRWETTARVQEYVRRGEVLRKRLAEELGDGFDVELDLWPVQDPV